MPNWEDQQSWEDQQDKVWQERLLREENAQTMSLRYPPDSLDEETRKYVEAAIVFMGADLDGKDVLEIGCGNGLLTKKIVRAAAKVTCIDGQKEMIDKTSRVLGSLADSVTFLSMYAQRYQPRKHDIVVCARVIVHNTTPGAFQGLVRTISECADTVFLLEPIDHTFPATAESVVRPEGEIVEAFPEYKIDRRKEYYLSIDRYVFLKLTRVNASVAE